VAAELGSGGGAQERDESFPEVEGDRVGEFGVVVGDGWRGLAAEVSQDGVDEGGGVAAAEAAALFDGLVNGDGGGDLVHAGELVGGQQQDFLDEGVEGAPGPAGVVDDAVAEGEEVFDDADVKGLDEAGGVLGVEVGELGAGGEEVGFEVGKMCAVEASEGDVAGGGAGGGGRHGGGKDREVLGIGKARGWGW
jgi:hypothetical protein